MPLFGQAVNNLQMDEAATAVEMGSERRLALGQALSYQGFFCYRQGQHRRGRDLLQRSQDLLQPMAGSVPSPKPEKTTARFVGLVIDSRR